MRKEDIQKGSALGLNLHSIILSSVSFEFDRGDKQANG